MILSERAPILFAELAERACAFARQLLSAGVTSGGAVAVQLPRGGDYVVAMLATYSIGATIVPISTLETPERVDRICRNIQAGALVTAGRRGSPEEPRVTAFPGQRPLFGDLPTPVAYILHTSGTTGVPKGSIIPSSALMNCLGWYTETLRFDTSSVIAQISRPSFDLSVAEIYLPLVTGGAMAIPTSDVSNALFRVVETMSACGVTTLQMVPTVLNRFLRAAAAIPSIAALLSRFADGGHMVTGGEAVPDPLRVQFYRCFPNAWLHNLYGPTETCAAVTQYLCPASSSPAPMLIGRPVPNVSLFLLDASREPVPAGAEGELWIGGAQNGLGYVADPEETARRFVVFDTTLGRLTLYRTGDLMSLTADGNLAFHRRVDTQVKFRGMRIELEELDRIAEASGACEAACTVLVDHPRTPHGQTLICFVQPESADTDRVLQYVQRHLPPDRWPTRIEAVRAFPVTATGKVDRKALSSIVAASDAPAGELDAGTEPAAPRLGDRLGLLLSTLGTLTNQPLGPGTRWRECGLDSLQYLDLQIVLLEGGYTFSENVFSHRGLTLSEVAETLRPVPIDALHRVKLTPTSSGPSSKFAHAKRELLRDAASEADRIGAKNLVLHASLIDIPGLTGDEATEAVLSAISPLLPTLRIHLPSFTPSYLNSRRYHWRDTASEMGSVSMIVRRYLGGVRTRHPYYSFVVCGPDQAAWAEVDWWRASPFGDDSQFGRLAAEGAVIVNLGTFAMTHPHRCEWLAGVPYMRYLSIEGECDFGEGPVHCRTEVYVRDVAGTEESFVLAQDVPGTLELIREHHHRCDLNGTDMGFIQVARLEQALVAALRNDPYCLLFAARRERARQLAESRGASPVS